MKPKKFKFEFDNHSVIYANTMVEMADLYFANKKYYDKLCYRDFTYNYKNKNWEPMEAKDFNIFASLYDKREKILNALEAIEEDFK